MNTTIYMVRHGAYVRQGAVVPFRRPGVHLSPVGVQQSEKLARFFADKNIAAVYASPMERTQETAKIISGGRPVITDERLNEVRTSRGTYEEGLPDEKSGWGKFGADWFTKRGGETSDEITGRMRSFNEEMLKKYKGRAIVVVSHGDPIMFLLADIAHKKPWEVPYMQIGEMRKLTFP